MTHPAGLQAGLLAPQPAYNQRDDESLPGGPSELVPRRHARGGGAEDRLANRRGIRLLPAHLYRRWEGMDHRRPDRQSRRQKVLHSRMRRLIDWLPLPAIFLAYHLGGWAAKRIARPLADRLLLDWDLRLFGAIPGIWLQHHWPRP